MIRGPRQLGPNQRIGRNKREKCKTAFDESSKVFLQVISVKKNLQISSQLMRILSFGCHSKNGTEQLPVNEISPRAK